MECTGRTPAPKECIIRLALPSFAIKRTLEEAYGAFDYDCHGNGQFLANEAYPRDGEYSITLFLPSALIESTVKHVYGEEPDGETQWPMNSNLGRCETGVYEMRDVPTARGNEAIKLILRCAHCSKRFYIPSILVAHLKTHTEDEQSGKSFGCGYCEKNFSHHGNIKRHVKTMHSGDKPFSCKYCDKGFVRSDYLADHENMHLAQGKRRIRSRIRPYQCSFCGMFFYSPSHVTHHERSHTGLKLFHCSYCGKGLSRQSSLMDHERTHSGERPYHCSHCPKSFSRLGTLRKHDRTHTGETPYSCHLCDKRFTAAFSLSCHLKKQTCQQIK